MSRIIVKNLPKKTTEEKIRCIFEKRGVITDLQLKYNKQGVFRQFAFVGYKTEEEANAAKEYYHNTFINTSKIKVEICHNLGEVNKPKPWDKVPKIETSDSKNKDHEKIKTKKFDKKKKRGSTEEVQSQKPAKKKKFDIPNELKDDPQFKEYLKVNENRQSKPVWAEDIDTNINSESEQEKSEESDQEKSEESEQEKSEESDNKSNKSEKKGDSSATEKSPQKDMKLNVPVKTFDDLFTIKIKNLPYHCKKSQIKKFFQPLKITSLRLPPKKQGFAYVNFKTEKDLKKALIKHRGFLDGHRVDVIKYVKKSNSANEWNNEKFKEYGKELNEDLLAETGRIFIRNLCYDVKENDIMELFTKYGPTSEVSVPFDFVTKESKGFAFVTFMFVEHALKAFKELDGTIFQGRVLHLIPAKPKKEYETLENETDFKKKKENKRKKETKSSHNWNILILGVNAVADAIAEKHGIEKSKLLTGFSKTSLAVRMALAETELIQTTRNFLIENGVQLDAFSQPAAKRSETVIVVKHLPAGTTAEEIKELFAKYGTISRLLIPPSGLVALVEFENPSEAKMAYSKLFLSPFGTLPLLLEWAPTDGLKKPEEVEKELKERETVNPEKETKEKSSTSEFKDPNEDIPPEAGTTIYVKNINFDTNQSDFEKHFKQCGPMHHATISTKKDLKTGKTLSMGFGFVQFVKKEGAVFALQNLQRSNLDGYSLELKFANRSITPATAVKRRKYEVKKQTSSKILVRNLPFQSSIREIRDLFKEFGELKNVRLPQKLGKPDEHRGFGFVEYHNPEDAERAFESLCHSTHLLNRRLVLEWANSDDVSVTELRKKTAEQYSESGSKKKLKKSKLKQDMFLSAARHGNDGDDNDEE